ncbi:MAG: DUF1178 family protein [Kordiimonadaceae bacterium]|nr:DUF1178 family protein [Kordiimonadaceae bacterium]
MIVFDLKCEHSHRFEAWFKSSSAYEDQLMNGLVSCPYCDSLEISKAPMAPNIATKSNQKPEPTGPSGDAPVPAVPAVTAPVASQQVDGKLAELVQETEKMLAKVRDHVQENCDYVGDNFAEEARKIHYGESEERGIYGESTKQETVDLLEEGITVLPLPMSRQTDS